MLSIFEHRCSLPEHTNINRLSIIDLDTTIPTCQTQSSNLPQKLPKQVFRLHKKSQKLSPESSPTTNFTTAPGRAPPTIRQRTILVPKGTYGPVINTKFSSKPRSAMKELQQPTPGSITKAARSPPIPTNNALGKKLLVAYLDGRLDMHSDVAAEAREHGVSLQNIEQFNLTTLYGAREDDVERLHARNAPLGSHYYSSPPYKEYGDEEEEEEEEEMSGGAAAQVNLLPAPQVETPPAPPRLIVSLPIPRGFKPAAATTTTAVALPRKTANRPPAPPGPPTNAVYAAERRPIPQTVQAVVDEILLRAARKSNKAGFPQRVDLRNMPSGMTDLDRRYGYITRDSGLMGFYGDLRLFNEATWKYLVSSGKGD